MGARKIDRADKISEEAFSIAEGARLKLCQAAKTQENSLAEVDLSLFSFGQLKANLLEEQLRDFFKIYSQIKSADFGVQEGWTENPPPSLEGALAALRKESQTAAAALRKLGGRDSREAVTDFGICGIPMLVALAVVDRAVSPSSGLAAKGFYFPDMLDQKNSAFPKDPDKKAASESSLTIKELLAGFYNESGAENKLELAREIKGKSIVCQAEVAVFCQKLAEIQDVTDSAVRVLGLLREN